MIKKWDIALIALLLCLSFIPEGLFALSDHLTEKPQIEAVVYVDGTVYKTVPLSGHKGTLLFTVRTTRGYNTIVVKNDTIGIIDADCPDKICIKQGFISQPGATAVCLPHRLLIEIKSARQTQPDIIPAN
ncbi:hypothetical protein HMPREF3033_00867 [Veillonellaceae bacterium DNF00751]|jgi:hypothetical protein|nr:hypothetical protein HMPREF3033_00867 [Veillonellaceae bacterium DNF00751]MUP50588.1 NusG domain II-containing protein [Veillonellaceae bacterium M1-70]